MWQSRIGGKAIALANQGGMAEGQGTCKTAVALLINSRSSADSESLTTGDVLFDSTSSDGNASSCSPTSSEAAIDSMSSCCQFVLGAPKGQTGQAALNVHAIILQAPFLGGKQLLRAFPSMSPLITWNGDDSSSGEDEEDRKDCYLCGILFLVCQLVLLGTEPWGEDAATSLMEGDGVERCAGVRDAELCRAAGEMFLKHVLRERCTKLTETAVRQCFSHQDGTVLGWNRDGTMSIQ
ncbi:UNVERIFIED_CONTAM: hypothetical protein FKN15_006870 [Acipenser sinensis]